MFLNGIFYANFDFDFMEFDGNCRLGNLLVSNILILLHGVIFVLSQKLHGAIGMWTSYLRGKFAHFHMDLVIYEELVEKSHAEKFERAAQIHEEHVGLCRRNNVF